MCGRFAVTLPVEAMAKLFAALPGNDLVGAENYNVCPTTEIAVAQSEGGVRRLRPMRWGFVPHWYKTPTDGPLLINARAETIAEKPAFRVACRERRCLIAIDGFYEWKAEEDGKQPFYVSRADGAPMVMAGVWQDWEREGLHLTTCAIVTTEANADLAPIHHRMPVVLEPEDWALWLGEAGHGAARLMVAGPEGRLQNWKVARTVNSNRASGPELRAPLEPQ